MKEERFFLVSDIHGQYKAFDELLKQINYNSKKDRMIILGDLIDRGPDSASVVERVIEEKILAIRGNHEEFLFSYLDDELSPKVYFTPLFGGYPTLKSYEKRKDPEKDFSRHLEFLESLPEVILLEDKYCLIHESFPEPYVLKGKIVVSGHTNTEIIAQKLSLPVDGFIIYDENTSNVYIDCTGKTKGRKLGCLGLTNKEEYYVFIDNLKTIKRRCPVDWI